MTTPPTVAERQRIERLVAAVMSGLDPRQAVGSTVTDRLAIVTAVMLSEASEKVDIAEDGSLVAPDAPQSRRYMALAALFDVMAETERPERAEEPARALELRRGCHVRRAVRWPPRPRRAWRHVCTRPWWVLHLVLEA